MRIPHLVICVIFVVPAPCAASVVEYNNNRNAWLTAVGNHTHITFQGFAANTVITNQYSNLGVIFTDGTDRIFYSPNAFPNDGVGLYGAIDTIALSFAEPCHALAVDFPGAVQFRLYWHGALTYTSGVGGLSGVGFFKGLISDQPFDSAVILDPTGNVNIDDLYFGGQVPAPGALAWLAASVIFSRQRRRTPQQ